MGVATTWKMRCPASIVAGDQAQEWQWSNDREVATHFQLSAWLQQVLWQQRGTQLAS
tara:strand:- start:204 stop:374 length:171 start_codon:yes stop_codon:yes gene_type:complete